MSVRALGLTGFFLFFLSQLAFAQYSVSGIYLDEENKAIPYANVLLLNARDSSLVKGAVTEENGLFEMNISKSGEFLVAIKYIGYNDFYSRTFTLNGASPNRAFGTLTGQSNSTELSEVVIEAERPLFEQKIDRTIINVQSNIGTAGGTALDVLERSPGVTVDRMNNSVSLAGKSGLRIMINGKITQLPLEAAIQMLDGMTSETIDRIELITTPPAKYEAQGDAGIINIVTKKSIDDGTNGNLSLFSGYGRKEKYGGNISLNSKMKNFNIYGDYSFRKNVSRQFFIFSRSFDANNNFHENSSYNVRDAFTRIHNGRIGADWNITNKTTIGTSFSITDRFWDMDANADIRENINSSLDRFILMNTLEQNGWLFKVANFNINQKIGSNQELSFNLDYIDYDSENPTDYLQDVHDENMNPVEQTTLNSGKITIIKTWVSKLDYSNKISDRVTLEIGGKLSLSDLQNNIEILEGGVPDLELSSDADMTENIGAGYAAATFNVSEKINIQAGMRYEHTITNIDTRDEPDIVDRNFGSWFPSFFFQNKITKNSSYVLSYSRRITRPSFFQIAPFVLFTSPDAFWSGNEQLLPAMTDAFKAEYRLKSTLLSLQYSHDKNSIAMFQPRLNEANQQVSKAENLDYRKNISLNVSFPIKVTDWWEFQINGNINYIRVKALFLDEPIVTDIQNYSLNGSSKFKLPKKWTAEISGFYNSKQLFGVAQALAFGQVNFGLEKRFENSSLRLSYSDVLQTRRFVFLTDIPEENLFSRSSIDFEFSVVNITYSTSFGNQRVKRRRRSTASEEEQQRFN